MQYMNKPLAVVLILVVPILSAVACQLAITPTDLSDLVQMQRPWAPDDTSARIATWMPHFNERGELARPDGYGFREEWIYIIIRGNLTYLYL